MSQLKIDHWMAAWQLAKDAEEAAKDARLTAELQILAILDKPETFKGTVKLGDFVVTYSESVKVDAEELNKAANLMFAAGTSPKDVERLFRWKPELNTKLWKEAPEHIKRALSGAIETKPSKPSFSKK